MFEVSSMLSQVSSIKDILIKSDENSHPGHILVLVTHPDVAILVIWFPVSSSVAVEETIPGGPVRTAVATLCCDSDHLLSRAQVHLEPLVMVTVQG